MRPAAFELLLSLTLLLPVAGARAEAPTRDQARCVRAMSKALVNLTGDLAEQSVECLDEHADEDLDGTLEECLLANPAIALEAADTDPVREFARRCDDDAPFGLRYPQSVSFAAVQGVSRALRDAFGADFDHALAKDDDDDDLAECQISVAEELLECQEARLEAFARCQKKGLRKGFESNEDLEACIGADRSGRIARKCDLADELADCHDDGVSLATAFPGINEYSPSDTKAGLTRIAKCQSCLALNTANDLSANCDLKDDGTVNGSCEVFTCNANPLTFPPSNPPDSDRKAAIELADGGVLQLNCPIVPNPTPTDNLPVATPAPPDHSPAYAMDHFAWNTFIAMNWPAMGPSDGDGTTRGIPDMTRSFKDANHDDVTVWETLKEKREVFYRGSCSNDPNLSCVHNTECVGHGICDLTKPPGEPDGRTPASLMWNGPLQYGQQGDPVQAEVCKGDKADQMPSRIVTSSTKLHFDSLDETLEVQSEARETVEQLCKGHVPDAQIAHACAPSNPERPTCCTIKGNGVGPRVWVGDPAAGGNPILYEVKVNYDYFDFVTEAVTPNRICELGKHAGASCFPSGFKPNGKPDMTCAAKDADGVPLPGELGTCTGTLGKYYIDTNALQAARPEKFNSELENGLARPSFLLPYRTNAFKGGAPHNKNATRGYDAQTCFMNHGYGPESEFPCRIGSVHLKAAWQLLHESDDPEDYHTADASYFKSAENPDDREEICRTSGTFGLIGLHIIQRTHNVRNPKMGTCSQTILATGKSGDQNGESCEVADSKSACITGGDQALKDGTGTCESPGFTQIGGTYIFATWEHTGNDIANKFTYANYDFRTADFYPNTIELGSAIPLKRRDPLLNATTKVNDEVRGALKCTGASPHYRGEGDSVWCNYRLIGTQFKHVNEHEPDGTCDVNGAACTVSSDCPSGVCTLFPEGQQQFHLANLVLESNEGLQNFHGQPPALQPISWYKRHTPYENSAADINDNFDGVCSEDSPSAGMPCVYDPENGTAANIMCGGARDDVGKCSVNSLDAGMQCSSDDDCNLVPGQVPTIGNKCVKPYCAIPFARGENNNFSGSAGGVNMGGCMGCHGVAQLNGYTFSFVSQDGQRGAGIDTVTPGQFEPAPTPLAEVDP